MVIYLPGSVVGKRDDIKSVKRDLQSKQGTFSKGKSNGKSKKNFEKVLC